MATEQRKLQGYIAVKVAAVADRIAPELLEYVGGLHEASVDASIAKAIAASDALVQRARTEMAQAPTGFIQHVQEGVSDLDAQAVRDMSLPEYIRRREALGTAPKSTLEFLGGF